MARKKETQVTEPETEQTPATQALDVMRTLEAGYSADRDLVNQLLGQAQMADAYAKFSLTISTSKLQFVKENKLYRALRDKKNADGQRLSGTWEEFCGLLGRSRQQVDEDIANLKAMGESALESMSRMGIGYRELRQFRKLPEDQRTALIEVAKTGDKDSFIDLAEELIAKHKKETETLSERIETQGKVVQELNATIVANERVIDGKEKTITTLQSQLAKLQNRDPEALEAERQALESSLLDDLHSSSTRLLVSIQAFAQTVSNSLETVQHGSSLHEAVSSTVTWLFQRIDEIAKNNGLPVDFSEQVTPSWMDAESATQEA